MTEQVSCLQTCPSNCCSPKGECLTLSPATLHQCKSSTPPYTNTLPPPPLPLPPQKNNQTMIPPPLPPGPPNQGHHKSYKRRDGFVNQSRKMPIQYTVSIIVMTILLLIILAFLIWQKCKKRQNQNQNQNQNQSTRQSSYHKSQISHVSYIGHLYPNNIIQNSASDLFPMEMQEGNFSLNMKNYPINTNPYVYSNVSLPYQNYYYYEYQDKKLEMYPQENQKISSKMFIEKENKVSKQKETGELK